MTDDDIKESRNSRSDENERIIYEANVLTSGVDPTLQINVGLTLGLITSEAEKESLPHGDVRAVKMSGRFFKEQSSPKTANHHQELEVGVH